MLQWLDVLIGLLVILLGVSLMIMILTQIISGLLNLRGRNLKRGLQVLIENTEASLKMYAKRISQEVLTHPFISDSVVRFGKKGSRLASAIRPNEFKNILHQLAESGEEDWRKHIKKYLSKIEETVDTWFDNAMDRVAQHFTAHTRLVTIIFSLIMALILHLDFFRLFEQVSNDAELRASLVISSDALLKLSEEIIGSSASVSNPYVAAIKKLQSEENALKNIDDPLDFKNRQDGEKWLREQLGRLNLPAERVEELLDRYGVFAEENIKPAIEKLIIQSNSIQNLLNSTRFQIIPTPYPGWDYSLAERHFWGVIVMAALLSLGAPFWFNALKTLTSLRPILAGKEEKERTARKPPVSKESGTGT